MATYYIRNKEHAIAIIKAYEHCTICAECPLNSAEGWKCSYLYDIAIKYMTDHKSGYLMDMEDEEE